MSDKTRRTHRGEAYNPLTLENSWRDTACLTPRILALFLFDPTRLPNETTRPPTEEELQDAKVVYYYPSSADISNIRNQCGLIEGLIQFSRSFTKYDDAERGQHEEAEPLRTLHTKYLTIVVEEVETDLWMVLVVRRVRRQEENSRRPSGLTYRSTSLLSVASAALGGPSVLSSHPKGQGDRSRREILFGERATSHEGLIRQILRNCYETFRLLHGRIRDMSSSTRTLIDLLDDFVPAYVDTVESCVPYVSFLTEFKGFHFAPVHRNTFLQIQSLIAILHREFPVLRHTALLYRGYMIHYSLNKADMAIIYNYLVNWNGDIASWKLLRPPYGRLPTAAANLGGGASSFGRANPLSLEGTTSDARRNSVAVEGFLFGPSKSSSDMEFAIKEEEASSAFLFLPTVYLQDGSKGLLVVFLYYGLMMVFILRADSPISRTPSFYMNLRAKAVGHPGEGGLYDLLRPIAALLDRVTNSEDSHRFVYFNSSNLAVRMSNRFLPRRSTEENYASEDFSRPVWGNPTAGKISEFENTFVMRLRSQRRDNQRDQRKSRGSVEEVKRVMYKSVKSGWIVSSCGPEREYLLFLDEPSMTYGEARGAEKQFRSAHFMHIHI